MKTKKLLKLSVFSFLLFFFIQISNIKATTVTAISSGLWTNSAIWDNGLPNAWDVVMIPSGIEVTITGVNGTVYENIQVIVFGKLELDGGKKLRLDCNSLFDLRVGGEVEGDNGGSKLEVCSIDVFVGGGTSLHGPASYGRAPLPIELVSFNYSIGSNLVNFNWQTGTETNNNFFSIEKSIDGINYTNIGEIKGAGNSTSLLSYNFVDRNPVNGVSYYRLKQTDFDGNYDYSSVLAVNYSKEISADNVNVFPNPSNTFSDLSISGLGDLENVSIEVIDVTGKKIVSETISKNQKDIFVLDVNKKLTAGIYFVKVLLPQNENVIKKIIVQ